MDFYCEVCDNFIKPKSKYNRFKPNTHEEFDICKRMELTFENPNKDDIDEVFFTFIIQHNKQYDHYLIKFHFDLVSNDSQYSTWIRSNLFNNKTMIAWKKYLEFVIDDFKDKG